MKVDTKMANVDVVGEEAKAATEAEAIAGSGTPNRNIKKAKDISLFELSQITSSVMSVLNPLENNFCYHDTNLDLLQIEGNGMLASLTE